MCIQHILYICDIYKSVKCGVLKPNFLMVKSKITFIKLPRLNVTYIKHISPCLYKYPLSLYLQGHIVHSTVQQSTVHSSSTLRYRVDKCIQSKNRLAIQLDNHCCWFVEIMIKSFMCYSLWFADNHCTHNQEIQIHRTGVITRNS